LKVIGGMDGHSDIRLTQNVYQLVYHEAKLAADIMNSLLTDLSSGPNDAVSGATRRDRTGDLLITNLTINP
jgi:hypothetical protein